ncbi:MAG TPA: hypothetical protein VMX57_02745 [Planctomycetota bacterium]|nr:hypothetical protein [Planctomycetota bacterium]
MSIRFLNPHNVTHGEAGIAKCREASVRSRAGDVRRLSADAKPFPVRTVALQPVSEITLVTEDVVQALAIAPGTTATLSFDVSAADGSADKTVTATNAVYLGPAEDLGGAKSGPGVASMQFVCHSSDGNTNPISIA